MFILHNKKGNKILLLNLISVSKNILFIYEINIFNFKYFNISKKFSKIYKIQNPNLVSLYLNSNQNICIMIVIL